MSTSVSSSPLGLLRSEQSQRGFIGRALQRWRPAEAWALARPRLCSPLTSRPRAPAQGRGFIEADGYLTLNPGIGVTPPPSSDQLPHPDTSHPAPPRLEQCIPNLVLPRLARSLSRSLSPQPVQIPPPSCCRHSIKTDLFCLPPLPLSGQNLIQRGRRRGENKRWG